MPRAAYRAGSNAVSGIKLSICNETYVDWRLERICEHVAACGYDGLEIAPFTMAEDPSQLTEKEAAAAGQIVRQSGLEVVGFHWLLVKPPGLHLCTPDDAVRRRTVEFAIHLARLCAAMGGSIMVWGSPKQRSVAPDQTYEDVWRRAADGLRQIAEFAGQLGVTIALEPLSPAETNFLTTAGETIRLLDEVAHPACRLHLDVKAMHSESLPIPEVIRQARGRLAHFHANDPQGNSPATGLVDFVSIAAALAEIQYQGYVSVEVFDDSPVPEKIAAESLAYLSSYFARGTP